MLKVPTTAGPVWFKANHGPLQHEAALVTLLAERVPDRVEPLLAADLRPRLDADARRGDADA